MSHHAPRSLVAAIDQGTTSSRTILFDRGGRLVASHQLEHAQLTPRPGWVEHDAVEILDRVRTTFRAALDAAGTDRRAVAAVGISDQRETTVVWDRTTGIPIHPAIVWQDTRTAEAVAAIGDQDRFRARTGLPVSTYSSALKLRWILDRLETIAPGRDPGELLFGTIDTWLIWNLTGGIGHGGGVHVTDVTNASRTMLMDLETCQWDAGILSELGIPTSMLPGDPGQLRGLWRRHRGAGRASPSPVISATSRPRCSARPVSRPGRSSARTARARSCSCTPGSGRSPSSHGLITTVAARIGERTTYALEGSVAVAGSLIQWLRDDLGLIADASEVEPLARSVPDSGDVIFVPAFSGLFAPHWRPDARGVIAGLTRYATKGHIARAALEATAFQVADLGEAMVADLGADLPPELRVDGGMIRNELLMQFQSDILGLAGRGAAIGRGVGARARPTPRGWRSGSGTGSTSCARWIGSGGAGRHR